MLAEAQAGKAAHTRDLMRITGLETATAMLGGQLALGMALGIGERAVRAKLAAERGIDASDLCHAAEALRQRAARLSTHADKLVALAEGRDHA